MSRFFITTPIYYVNDKPHLGHAYTTICADVLARLHRQHGGEVFFLTGTDEHGAKVQQSAEAAGLTPEVFAEKTAETFKATWKQLGLSHDYFIRTSDPRHEKVVRELLQRIYDRGFIYEGWYEGLYCIGCEKFLQESDLVNGLCPLHPKQKPVQQKEKNYFFKLSSFRDKLLQALEQGEYKIVPEGRHNEIVGKLKQGLEDISISRSEVTWGVKVPWDETQTVYVWVDALINYYSATQFVEQAKGFWPAQVHLLGKDILWFHAVIWEALLLAAELALPKIVAAHGFFTIDGQKMSKSIGNVIAPGELVAKFGLEATRYLVLAEVPFTSDGDVSWARFGARYESDLANGLGNTFSRVTTMIASYLDGQISKGLGVELPRESVAKALEEFHFDQALAVIMSWVKQIDGEIESSKPWQLAKKGESDELGRLLSRWHDMLLQTAQEIAPFMPATAKAIQDTLSADRIIKALPLFPRLDNK